MSKKITQEEFLKRFYRSFPVAQIEPLNYTAISNPLTIRCGKCGKHFTRKRARDFLATFNCCGDIPKKVDRLKEIYAESKEFEYVKQPDKDHLIVKHLACGQELKRTLRAAMDNPFACVHCETNKSSQILSIAEVQKTINTRFGGDIQILEYNGQLKKNRYKCLKCGLIFTQQQTCLMQSRGCPKCDRFHSNGERQMRNLLVAAEITFEEQFQVPELPLQKFDFAIFDKNGKLIYFIEVQGEQHREEREIFRDGLKKIQKRDEKKRQYCATHQIPLYEITYQKGKLLNIDILPF